MKKHIVFVFARLKPSQINYKIIPLSKSENVEKVIILRKTPLKIDSKKIECLSLPGLFRPRLFYWLFTGIYGAFLIKKHRATLILNYNIFPHGFNAFLASVLTGIPFIFSEINEDTRIYYKRLLPGKIIKKIMNRAKVICVPGNTTMKFWNDQDYDKTIQLHSTIDTSCFIKDLSVKKTYDFLYVGVFDDNKRAEVILEAFNSVCKKKENARLCLLGYGPNLSRIQALISENKLEDHVDIITTENVLSYYRRSKIFIMATLSEGLPCALMEAMSTELIALAPHVGDIADILKHEDTGFVHNNTLSDLTEKMEYVLENYDLLGHISSAGRNIILERHSYTYATQTWNELLKTIPVE